MSVSIYYTVERQTPLTPLERAEVDRLVAQYSIREHVKQRAITGQGHNGMDFCLYDPNSPSGPAVILEGSTQLPNDDAMWELVQHWCALLSAIRRVLPTASWHVHVDDHDIQWDAKSRSYDPTA